PNAGRTSLTRDQASTSHIVVSAVNTVCKDGPQYGPLLAHSPTQTMSADYSSPGWSPSRLDLRRSGVPLVAHLLLAALIATSSVSCLADGDPAKLRAVAISGMPAPGGGTFDRFLVEWQPANDHVDDSTQT